MTEIEQALVHYDGDNSKPYCDLVYKALKLLQKVPCQPGDTISRILPQSSEYSIVSDTVSKVIIGKKHTTVYTKSIFYPINCKEYRVGDLGGFPFNDYYIGNITVNDVYHAHNRVYSKH